MILRLINLLLKKNNYKLLSNTELSELSLLSYDNKIKSIFRNIINTESPVIFDIGAHNGDSIFRYRDIFSKSIIHSFEPNIELFKLLEAEFADDIDIHLNNHGISNQSGELKLNIASNSLMSSIEPINYESKFFKKRNIQDNNYSNIKVDTIDNYCLSKSINKIDIIKINVQGHEPKCLEGSKEMLKEKKIDFLVLELDSGDRYDVSNQFYDYEK